MSALLSFVVVLLYEVEGYKTCQSPDSITKYTSASTDSHRDYVNAHRIFPDMIMNDDEAADVIDGMCGNQMELELPFTCFNLNTHSWLRADEMQAIQTVEQHYIEKWQNVMSSEHNSFQYDAFLDFSLSFFVSSLDPYLEQWQSLDDEPLHYIGIEWKYDLDDIDLEIQSTSYRNKMFYSLLVHSPESSINYEFISYTKPSDEYYHNMKFIKSGMMRATFKTQNNPYPWNRDDEAAIVPLRISRAATDISDVIQFYRNVMQSEILYHRSHFVDGLHGDNIKTKTVFLSISDSEIELQFVERPLSYTAGEFSVEEYEQLLVDAHNEAMTTPYCGVDPWLNNHYVLNTAQSSASGFMDRILAALDEQDSKYRIYKSTEYVTFIFEPTGQSIQVTGDAAQYDMEANVPLWNEEWCETECVEDVYTEEQQLHLFGIGSVGEEHHEKYLLGTLTGMTAGVIMCAVYYFYKKWKKKRFIQNLMNNNNDDGTQTPLITKP